MVTPPTKTAAGASCAIISEAQYASYLTHLAALISHRSVVTDDDALHAAIAHCKHAFAASLEPLGWTVTTDTVGNLRCIPPALDTSRPVLWLNAHIDTVDAAPPDFGGHNPFICRETPTHLIGRGANDCKAGVAFMLWYASRIAAGEVPAHNGGFLVTRREEAGSTRPRTAAQFADDFAAGVLPMSSVPRGTFVCFLENTVSLASHLKTDTPEIAVYDRERHSFVLVCRGSLAALGRALLSLEDHHEWKAVAAWPVVVEPVAAEPVAAELVVVEPVMAEPPNSHEKTNAMAVAVERGGGSGVAASHRATRRVEMPEALCALGAPSHALQVHRQDGGHSCTVRNEQNQVYRVLVREALRASAEARGGSDGLKLPPAALTAWVAATAQVVDSARGDEGVEEEGGDVALLWSGVASQPTRVATTVTTLPRTAVTIDGGLSVDFSADGDCDEVSSASGSKWEATVTVTAETETPVTETAVTEAAVTEAAVTETPVTVTAVTETPVTETPLTHELVLNYRGLKPINLVATQIGALKTTLGEHGVRWGAGADLASGEGAQQHAFVGGSRLPDALDAVVASLNGQVTLKFEPNPGRSDASHLWRALPDELRGERIVPFTCGPGHRSHRCASEGVMRKTHGPNEGFEKATGKECLPFFVELVRQFAV